MRHFSLPLIGIAATLSACGPINRSVESVHQPVVSRADYVLDVDAAALAGPQSAEAQRVAAWFTSLDVGYGDDVTVDDPTETGVAKETIAALLADQGLLLAGDAPETQGEIGAGKVRVVVSRSAASVSGCPNWDRISAPEYEASTMSNYGCATNANLAMMVANPADLVRGQTGYHTDARAVNKAVKAYRDRLPTGANNAIKSESTGGK